MVAKHLPAGLIAATRADATAPLDDFSACCDWPLLLAASPRRLHRELMLHDPPCVLFWSDDPASVARAARLIAWTRQRGSRPYRVAVGFEPGDEAVFRIAGAHSVLPAQDIPSLAEALRTLMESAVRPVPRKAAGARHFAEARAAPNGLPADLVRPP